MYTHSSRDTAILFSGWKEKATKKVLFLGLVFVYPCKVQLDYVPGSLNAMLQLKFHSRLSCV